MSIATIVKGNTFSLAIPLQVYAVEDGEVVLRDYTPESGDNITIRLKGDRRNYTYIPSTNGSTAFIHLEGSEVVGVYAVEVEIVKDDDSKLTSMRFEQLSIVESIDELNEGQITEGIEQGAIYLDPEIFIAGEDGRGIVSIVKTATSGLVDTYTITYTDNTTSTFNVTNGENGINGQDGADGVGIASIAKTGTQGLIDTYTITMTNGTTYTYQVTNGSDATQVQSDWSQSDSTAVDFIKNKPTIPTIPATATQSEINAGSSTSQRTFTPKLMHDNAYIKEASGIPLLGLDPNKFYDFGTVSSAITIPDPLTTNLVSNALNFYALRFIAGADNLSITFPTGVEVDGTPTINTGDYVEIMINLYVENNTNHFYASIKVWQAQQ